MAVSRTANFGRRGVAPAPASVAHSSRRPAPAPLLPPVPGIVPRILSRIPFLTIAIAVILVLRFQVELAGATDFSAPNTPGHFSLLAMGAADRDLVFGQGEWWRLFTASALHGSYVHLIGNVVTLLTVGALLEPLIGIGWFAAVYFTGGFVGQLVSTLFNAPANMSVGASGAIMATLAALFAFSFHHGARRAGLMRRVAAGSLFPALIPTVSGGGVTDINAHLGGCMTGAAIALLILIVWNEDEPHPPYRSLAAIIAGLWLAMMVWAFAAAGPYFARYAAEGLNYMPPGTVPTSIADMEDKSLFLITHYSKDPRAHLFRGIYFLEHNEPANAEPHLRDAMDMGDSSEIMTDDFRGWARALLGLDLMIQNQPGEARRIAAPLCGRKLDSRTQGILDGANLC